MPQPLHHGLTHARTRVDRSHGEIYGALGGGFLALFVAGVLQGAALLRSTSILGVQ